MQVSLKAAIAEGLPSAVVPAVVPQVTDQLILFWPPA